MKDYQADNLKLLKNDIFEVCKRVGRDVNEIKLIAVSKTFPVEDILTVFNAGQIDFGENKPQEMKEKQCFVSTRRSKTLRNFPEN